MVDNLVYDDINMRIENYIVSMSQNFLHHYPAESELQNATLTLEDEQFYSFGGNGNSKEDYNTLFFNHDGYFEGQVISAYNKLLYRNPSSSESTNLAIAFKNDNRFKYEIRVIDRAGNESNVIKSSSLTITN